MKQIFNKTISSPTSLQAYVTCTLGVEQVGFIMICYGAVDAVLSLSVGKLVQCIGRRITLSIGAVLAIALYVLLIVWKPAKETPYLFYLASGFLGSVDAVWQTQINGKLKSFSFHLFLLQRKPSDLPIKNIKSKSLHNQICCNFAKG